MSKLRENACLKHEYNIFPFLLHILFSLLLIIYYFIDCINLYGVQCITAIMQYTRLHF